MLEVADLRRVAGWALVAGLCISAAVAIVALLTGSWSDTSWRVVGTSLGFSVFTSTAAAGAALRLRPQGWARVLAVRAGALRADELVTLAAIVRGESAPAPGRPRLFKSTGMAWEDAVVAGALLAAG